MPSAASGSARRATRESPPARPRGGPRAREPPAPGADGAPPCSRGRNRRARDREARGAACRGRWSSPWSVAVRPIFSPVLAPHARPLFFGAGAIARTCNKSLQGHAMPWPFAEEGSPPARPGTVWRSGGRPPVRDSAGVELEPDREADTALHRDVATSRRDEPPARAHGLDGGVVEQR